MGSGPMRGGNWVGSCPHSCGGTTSTPYLVFFGDSYTTRPGQSEEFQARYVAVLMDALNVYKMILVGLRYGGFVAYSLAAQFPERVERVVICIAG
ncbi:uncharacterized protein LOC116207933 [Punica granatum]|uniref:Uncharacterized protein LOC116207933 n=1 Tax=Punica granatum TaxID=22663 RepID=A0A6P8DRA9_PUNGR|nr:uncharacterized protein LOC116207933 [Punica granatum]